MANRVVMGALPGGGQGLRVSRPGYNVLDNGLAPKNVSFDSRWSTSARVYLTGTFTATPSGSGDTYSNIGFGVDFGVIPPVMVMRNRSNASHWLSTEESGVFTSTSSGFSAHVRIYTSYMQLRHEPVYSGAPNITYRYIVLRPL